MTYSVNNCLVLVLRSHLKFSPSNAILPSTHSLMQIRDIISVQSPNYAKSMASLPKHCHIWGPVNQVASQTILNCITCCLKCSKFLDFLFGRPLRQHSLAFLLFIAQPEKSVLTLNFYFEEEWSMQSEDDNREDDRDENWTRTHFNWLHLITTSSERRKHVEIVWIWMRRKRRFEFLTSIVRILNM